MAFVVKDRVKETTTTSGTGTVTLAGAVTGYQSFSVIGDGNDTYYTITLPGSSEWEVGVGKYTASGTTLSRDTVLASSNSNSLVPFSAGTKDVFVVYPAEKAVIEDLSNNVTLPAGLTVNGGTVISTNSTTDALRITQIGTGNALVVEDEANPDSTPVVVDASGNVGIGTTTPSAMLDITNTAGGTAGITAQSNTATNNLLYRASTDANAANLNIRKARGTLAAPTAVATNDIVGNVIFQAYGGTNSRQIGALRCGIENYTSDTNISSYLSLNTTNAGTAFSERMRITAAGNVGIGIAAPSVALDVLGTIEAQAALTQDAVAIAGRAGGTGSFVATITPTTLSASRTVTLPDADINFTTGLGVANGGTGTTSLTANNVILGNGTSAVQFVAPGTSGNVLTSNGTTWTSAAPAVTLAGNNAFTGANTFYNATGQTFGTATSTQDGIIIAGSATGSATRRITVQPAANLSASRTLTLPDPGSNETLGYLNIPQNSQSAAYTLVLTDAGKHILHPSADTTARTFTIPANGTVAFPIGTAVTFINQNGAGVVTIAITTDTMRLAGAGTTGSRTLAANGIATAIKITSTEWIISGTGLT